MQRCSFLFECLWASVQRRGGEEERRGGKVRRKGEEENEKNNEKKCISFFGHAISGQELNKK
jgi:hypothetical protein